MMNRLLVMKKCFQDYPKHPTTPPKLTTSEWLATINEVWSLLDYVVEATARIQYGANAFFSQSIVLMAYLVKMLREDTQEVR